MKKNDVFTFTASNGVKVTAIVIDCLGIFNFEKVERGRHWGDKYLCYAQNRLFYLIEWNHVNKVINDDFIASCDGEYDWHYALKYHSHEVKTTWLSDEIIVDYCILPDYDAVLENYFHQQDKA